MTAPSEQTPAAPLAGVLACGDCDQLYRDPGEMAALGCVRCGAEIADGGHPDVAVPLALAMTALLLFFMVALQPLLIVEQSGLSRQDMLGTGAISLAEHGLWPLTPAVLFFSMIAPAARLVCLGYVLAGLHSGVTTRYTALAMKLADQLRPWAMLDVFLVGAFVAYTRLGAIVHTTIGPGGWALIVLVATILVLENSLTKQLVWKQIPIAGEPPQTRHEPGAYGTCLVCGLVMALPQDEAEGTHCSRCGAAIEKRKKDAISRTWALIAAAAMFYIPANVLPVMTIVRLGRTESDTIYTGVRELIQAQMWTLAAIVFTASIAVPMLKLTGLSLLLLSIHLGWTDRLQDRTRLYRIIDVIGRWSNIDVFMVSILTALVQFGNLSTVRPGPGILPFALVVLITMFAAATFDPRLMWDRARERAGDPAAGGVQSDRAEARFEAP